MSDISKGKNWKNGIHKVSIDEIEYSAKDFIFKLPKIY